jgi:small nuclear ribonucleoprotein (snRNP)-like protein
MALRCGTSAMFRLVINPKMKKSAVTITNGTKYPGDVNAVDCFVSAAIEDLSPFPERSLAR